MPVVTTALRQARNRLLFPTVGAAIITVPDVLVAAVADIFTAVVVVFMLIYEV